MYVCMYVYMYDSSSQHLLQYTEKQVDITIHMHASCVPHS